jgi:2-hydroxy-3-keto-5-methylthiopentenyl-1-phosphate phosphatase
MIIIADFSKTFTTADMPTTWSVFAKSGILDDTYIKNRNDLYEKYFPKEQLHDITSTEEWFLKHMELLVQSGLTLEQIDTLVMDDTYFAPRAGVYEFLQEIQKQGIPLYIVSSGIKTCIDRWFQLRYNFVPAIVIANEFIFEDGKIIGVDEESIICSLDKSIELEFEH